MKKLSLIVIFLLYIIKVSSQGNVLYQTGITAEQNLKAIGSLAPYSTGGVGFDTRYEGTKGSPRLFDTLLPSFLQVKGQDYYIQLQSNIDIERNSLIFLHPKTGKFLSIPSGMVKELKINSGGKEMIFRITTGKNSDKDVKAGRFFQVLREGQIQFIKLPVKKLIPADYKALYSADRRYDEYTTYYKYYIMSSDSVFHQIQLTKKSLIKIFPDKKTLISNVFEAKSKGNNEEKVLTILDQL